MATHFKRSKKLSTVLLLALSSFFHLTSCAQKIVTSPDPKRMEQIGWMFDRMEAQGVATGEPMLYGYFFFDKGRSHLEKLNSELVKQKYSLVRLEKNDSGDFTLHVEKVETHSRSSLLLREAELKALANRFSVETYDGWDVGNADASKPLVSNESFLAFMSSKKGDDLFILGNRLYDLDVNDRAVEVFGECIKQKIKADISTYKLAGALI